AERGLPAPRLTDDANRLAAANGEINVAHRNHFGLAREKASPHAKAARKLFSADQRGAHGNSRHLMHRVARSDEMRSRTGESAVHSGPELGQRGAKQQPGGRALGRGTVPGIGTSRPLAPSGTLVISAAV